MTTLELYNRVEVVNDVEVEPLCIIYKGTKGCIIDTTCPNYYLVRLDNGDVKWIDGKHLRRL